MFRLEVMSLLDKTDLLCDCTMSLSPFSCLIDDASNLDSVPACLSSLFLDLIVGMFRYNGASVYLGKVL